MAQRPGAKSSSPENAYAVPSRVRAAETARIGALPFQSLEL